MALVYLCTSSCFVPAFAQRMSLATDALGYAQLGTLNAELSYSIHRHWTAIAGGRYNPFSFKFGSDNHVVNAKQRTGYLGARFWPWHVFSGWWVSGKFQYQEYNMGGLRSPKTREGERIGGGVAAGYTYMINPHLNIEFAVGGWAGRDDYRIYECPVCGLTLDEGKKFFILPNDISVALSFIF